jgi:hypothetical protein
MGIATGVCDKNGCRIDITVSGIPMSGQGKPGFARITALVDTGSFNSSISPKIVKKLGLLSTGEECSTGIGNAQVSAQCYPVRFFLDSRAAPFDLNLGAYQSAEWDILLGLDVLGCHLVQANFLNRVLTLYHWD